MNHVLNGLAANPALPSALVDRLIAVADADLVPDLAARTDLSRAQVLALAARLEEAAVQLAYDGRLAADDVEPVAQPDAALALLDQGADRPHWARLLANDPLVERREKLAACPDLPLDVAQLLAVDRDIRVVAELALWTTPDVATRLAHHPHAEVRRSVAANEATPPQVLAALLTGQGLPPAQSCLVCDSAAIPFLHDPYGPRPECDLPPGASCDGSHQSTVHETQQNALRNPSTPPSAVVGFAGHPSVLLRCELAARPDLPPDVYAQLAHDPVPMVRAQIAGNPAIDAALIRSLADDRGHDVQRRLAHQPALPLDLLTHLAGTTRLGSRLLPRIVAASPSEIEELAASPSPTVRMLLAQRRDLPTGVRDALARDSDAKVLKSIAPHPGLSEAQLRAMVQQHGIRVLAKVATNPDATPALLEDLSRHQPPAQKAFREIARHHRATAAALLACLSDRQARPIAAVHPALRPAVIVGLLADNDWQVVEGAAANPSLPLSAMADLLP